MSIIRTWTSSSMRRLISFRWWPRSWNRHCFLDFYNVKTLAYYAFNNISSLFWLMFLVRKAYNFSHATHIVWIFLYIEIVYHYSSQVFTQCRKNFRLPLDNLPYKICNCLYKKWSGKASFYSKKFNVHPSISFSLFLSDVMLISA